MEDEMKRRSILALATGLVAVMSAAGRRASAAEGEKPGHRLVLHVAQNDAETMNAALNNATNAAKFYADAGSQAQIEIVANGPGFHMFRADTSPVKGRLMAMHAHLPNVVFSACNKTKEAMEAAESKEIAIVAEARLVPSGVVRLMELQDQGWSYVRP
jgi:intracellular sulfur oxidation DsrE/DsrF family protein